MKHRHRTVIVVLVAMAGLWASTQQTALGQPKTKEESPTPSSRRDFKPRKLLPPQKAIVDAPTLMASEVKGEVIGKELVLGVVVNGKARAYPINMLTGPRREIINDQLGGAAIAATW